MRRAGKIPEVLECTAEFGAEVNSFVPFINFLYETGEMEGRRIRTYRGMRPFYPFLAPDQIIEKTEPRRWVWPPLRPRWLPNRDDHFPRPSPRERFPDYRALYAGGLGFSKPIIAIHNKYNSAYGIPPLNYFPLREIEELFERYKHDHQIVFIPSSTATLSGYSGDHQRDRHLDEASVLARHPEVTDFNQMVKTFGGDYNKTKLRLYANTHVYFTVQGGNAHLCSLFQGSLVAILHRVGQEIRFSYAHGHFQYAANPAPLYLIAPSVPDFMRAARAVEDFSIEAGQVRLGPRGSELHRRYGEARLR